MLRKRATPKVTPVGISSKVRKPKRIKKKAISAFRGNNNDGVDQVKKKARIDRGRMRGSK